MRLRDCLGQAAARLHVERFVSLHQDNVNHSLSLLERSTGPAADTGVLHDLVLLSRATAVE